MTEPDLVTLGDRVSLDDCSVVAHINSRGNFALNKLHIADGYVLRALSSPLHNSNSALDVRYVQARDCSQVLRWKTIACCSSMRC